MIWIEMSRDKTHGGGEWGFSKCLWSPAYKQEGQKRSWLFWKNLLLVQQDDIIIHLRGAGPSAAFVGYSIAATDGHQTIERPPQAGIWSYATSYFRVLLKEYHAFNDAILLSDFFLRHENELIEYLKDIRVSPVNRFFVYQAKRLQCLNGAYLSICDNKLLSLILSKNSINNADFTHETVDTSEVYRQVKQRVGHGKFSGAVKANYNFRCCFPNCTIQDPKFLVGSHIARWVDNPAKRGDISNGLCLCVFHDKAFERGYFSLDDKLYVIVNDNPEIHVSSIFLQYIKPFEHQAIDSAQISPNKEALAEHRFRCGISD